MKDISYGPHQRHKLDLYVPTGSGPFPVVIFVHGGGWQDGDKARYPHLGEWLARHGILCAMMNYRLTPEVRHPSHTQDCARAVAWLYQTVGDYGGDVDRLYLTGYSAGGHIAALLALDERYLGEWGLSPAIFRGVVTYSGIYRVDWTLFLWGYWRVFRWGERAMSSPESYVRPGLPPWVVIYASRDLRTLDKQALRFYNKLTAVGCEARLMVIDSCHPLLTENMVGRQEAEALIRFFRGLRDCEIAGLGINTSDSLTKEEIC